MKMKMMTKNQRRPLELNQKKIDNMGLESKVVEDVQKDNLPLIDREKV